MSTPFVHHSVAALALLNSAPDLRAREGQFLGGIMFTDELTAKQLNWLRVLLSRHELPPLAEV